MALLFPAALLLLHFSARANLIGLGLAGILGAVALFQWPMLGALYISFSLFGRLASLLPGIDTAIVVLTLAVFTIKKLLSGSLEWRFPPAARWAFLWLAWMTATLVWAANAKPGLEALSFYVKSLLVFFLIVEAAQSYRKLIYLILAALGGAFFAVLISTYTGYRFFFSGAAGELSQYVAVETTRLYGLWFDPNYFALALLALIGVSFALWRTRLKWTTKLIAVGGFVAVVVGILVSLSRAALLSAFIALLLCLWAERRRLRLFLLIGGIVTLLLILLPIGLMERVETLTSGMGDASLQNRGRLLKGGIDMAIDAFPFGVGLGNYYHHSLSFVKTSKRMLSHNSYIDVIAEGGIIALFLFGGFVLSLFKATRARRHRFDKAAMTDNLAIGLRISLIGFLLGATFLSAAMFVPFWWLAGLIAAKLACDQESKENEATTLAPIR